MTKLDILTFSRLKMAALRKKALEKPQHNFLNIAILNRQVEAHQ
jgi:hypothetical protein